MRFKSILNLLFVVIIAASIVISLPVISFASTQAVNDAAANTKLTNIYNRLGNMYDRMAATNAYLGNIQTYTQNTQTYLQYIYGQLGAHTGYSGDIYMQVVGVKDMVQAVGGQTADVSSKLITTNNYLSNIDSKIVDRNYTQYIDQIESKLDSLETIDWIDTGLTLIRVQDPSGNTISSYNTTLTYDYIDFIYPVTGRQYNNIFKFNLPFTANAVGTRNEIVDHIEFIRNGSVMLSTDVITEVSSSRTYVSYYFGTIPTSATNNEWTLRVYLKRAIQLLNATPNILMIQHDTLDDMLLSYRFFLTEMKNNISDLKEVYASDDVIAAKEDQQAYEDQAISDFTGGGSAAASTSDTSNMKNVSSAIKSGLDSGGSVNGALGVFNTSGGLWDWFSQSNYDEINGTQTRSRGSDKYIDFYSINQDELNELLEDYR